MAKLANLKELSQKITEDYLAFDTGDIRLPYGFRKEYKDYRINQKNDQEFIWYDYSYRKITNSGYVQIIPNQSFYVVVFAIPFHKELEIYKGIYESLYNSINDKLSFKNSKEFAVSLRSIGEKFHEEIDENNELNRDNIIKYIKNNMDSIILKEIKNLFTNDKDVNNFILFICDYSWWGGGKTINRHDYFVSPILNIFRVQHNKLGYLEELLMDILDNKDLIDYLNEVSSSHDKLSFNAKNYIIYGAPGTGKSFNLKERYEDETGGDNTVRVTFHPEYTYHDFVGTYKPVSLYKNTGEEIVTTENDSFEKGTPVIDYQFVPGPFTKILIKSFNNPAIMHTLIIEELNRANAPAVFGDLFQLLDRDNNGESIFSVEPDPELMKFIKDKTEVNTNSIVLPKNLNIVATMNSADQGVFTLDSAFKRRWEFEYLPISFDGVKHSNEKVSYRGIKIEWKSFVNQINEKLGNLEINEDRHIGPYFLKEGEPQNSDLIANKLFTYLWDDVVRYRRDEFFDPEINTFGDLYKRYNDGSAGEPSIFNFKFDEEKSENRSDV